MSFLEANRETVKSSESGCRRIFEELGSQTAEYLTLHESLKRYLNNSILGIVNLWGWGVCEINHKNTLFGSYHELIHWLKIQIAFMQKKNGSYANFSCFLLPLVSDGRVIYLVYFLGFLVLGLLWELPQTGTNVLNSLKWYCASCSRAAFFPPKDICCVSSSVNCIVSYKEIWWKETLQIVGFFHIERDICCIYCFFFSFFDVHSFL